MKVQLAKRARRQIHKLPKTIATRILRKMHWYAAQEDPLSFAKRMTDPRHGGYRFRIGDYRVFCDVVRGKVQVLYVLSIKHRQSAYDDV